MKVIITEGGYGKNDQVCDVTDGDWSHTNVKFLRGAYISQWMIALAAQHPEFVLPYSDKDQMWMTFTGNNGSGGAVVCTQPNFTGATAIQQAFNATQTWLNSTFIPNGNVITCTGSPGTEVCTLPVTKAGLPAEFKWYNGWLVSTSVSTSFTTQQVYDSSTGSVTTSATSGTVTLKQQPVLLFSSGSTGKSNYSTILVQ